MELTREQAIEEHRKMWNWIADETEKTKECKSKTDYLARFYPTESIFSDCFCCEYAIDDCSTCPIDWESECEVFYCIDKQYRNDKNGLFSKWGETFRFNDYKEAARIAKKIANLSERKC